jgi:hypothetical protein
MLIWYNRLDESVEYIGHYVDAICCYLGHWTHAGFMPNIEKAIKIHDKFKKPIILFQVLFKPDEKNLSSYLSSSEFLEENLRVRANGLGIHYYSCIDCEPYSETLRRVLTAPLLDKLRVTIKTIPKFDFATPQLYYPDIDYKIPSYSAYSPDGFVQMGKRNITQWTYRTITKDFKCVQSTDVIGIAVSIAPPNNEHTPEQALNPELWKGRDKFLFPIGDIIATAKELGKILSLREKK